MKMVSAAPSRRGFLGLLGITGAAAVGTLLVSGCTHQIDANGNVVDTLNVAKINAYLQALDNGGDALLASPMVVKLLGDSIVTLAKTAVDDLAKMGAAFNDATKGKVTITTDKSSIMGFITSALADAQTLSSQISQAISTAQLSVLPSETQDVIAAFRTVVSLLQALLATASAKARALAVSAETMSEAQALQILKVALPKAAQ